MKNLLLFLSKHNSGLPSLHLHRKSTNLRHAGVGKYIRRIFLCVYGPEEKFSKAGLRPDYQMKIWNTA